MLTIFGKKNFTIIITGLLCNPLEEEEELGQLTGLEDTGYIHRDKNT